MARLNSRERNAFHGASVRLRRTGVVGAQWFNVGAIEGSPNASLETQRVETYDERGGAAVVDESRVVRATERYRINTRNHEDQVFALYAMADVPGAHGQAAATHADNGVTVEHGSEHSLVSATGQRIFNVTNVSVVPAGGGAAFIAGTDYVLDAAKGVIFWPTNSGIADAASVDISADTVVESLPLVLPQTKVGGIGVEAEFWMVGDDGADQVLRQIPSARLTSTGERQMGVQQANFLGLELTVLNDPLAAEPAGRIVRVK